MTALPLLAADRGGHLLIIGGGERPPMIGERFLQRAGGTAARVVVLPFASSEPGPSGQAAATEFRALGAADVQVLTNTLEAAAGQIRQATGVYLTGGDQVRLMSALQGTSIPNALHALWKQGGVIAGTSAGAAVMSALMITGAERGVTSDDRLFRSIQQGRVVTTNGLGFLTNAVVDQHFIARRRSNRLFSVVLEHPALLGLGIDEGTAIDVGPDQRFEVLGCGAVMVLDARHAAPPRWGPQGHLAATDLRVHLLVAGDRFDLTRGRPIVARPP